MKTKLCLLEISPPLPAFITWKKESCYKNMEM